MLRPLAVLMTTSGVALASALPVATASAAHTDKPVIVSHTYQVVYDLSGRLIAHAQNGPDQGFCPGTNYTEDVTFDFKVASRIKTKLDGDALTASKTVIPGTDIGTWSDEGSAYSSNDCSGTAHAEKCEGTLKLRDDDTNNNLFVGGKKTKLSFSFNLQGPPVEASKASDCDGNTDITPPALFDLGDALGPYDNVALAVPLVKLATGKQFKGSAKPLQFPTGYNLSTCGGSPGCDADISSFKHTITIQQVR